MASKGILYVHLKEGNDLKLEKNNGRVHAVFSHGSLTTATEQVKSKPNPKFEQSFLFSYNPKHTTLDIKFYLEDFNPLAAKGAPGSPLRRGTSLKQLITSKKDKKSAYLLGEISIPLEDSTIREDWFPLKSVKESGVELGGRVLVSYYIVSANSGSINASDKLKEPKFEKLVKILTSDNEFHVVSSLTDSTDPAETDKLAPALVRFFNHYGKISQLLKWGITKEVKLTSSAGVLFRANSMAIKLVSVYSKLVGLNYLKYTLTPLIKEVYKLKLSEYELDPTKLKEKEDKENAVRMQSLVQKFFDTIVNSAADVPKNIKKICYFFYTIVGSRFKEHSIKSIGSFFFLRFVCPSLVTPESYFFDEIPSTDTRRILVLVAKVLQNLANNIEFGGKEVYMQPLNSFIKSNMPRLSTFFETLTKDVTDPETFDCLITFSEDEILSDVLNIHKYLGIYLDKMSSIALEDRNRTVPNQIPLELIGIIEDIQQELKNKNTHSIQLPFARYTKEVHEKGVLKLHEESSFDRHWKEQQQQMQSLLEEESDMLNVAVKFNPPAGDLCIVADSLLRQILELYVKHQGKPNLISQSPKFQEFVTNCCELQAMSLYANEAGLLTFWINIFNTLVLHLHVIMGPPQNSFQRKLFFTGFKYRIGSHSFSLSDIKDGILRCNPVNKATKKKHFQGADYRKALSLSKFDPRIHFALSYLSQSSPEVRVYKANTIDEDLQVAGQLYLQKHLKIDTQKNSIILPKLFEFQLMDFATSEHDLLIWIFQFLETRKRLDLMLLLESNNYIVSYTEFVIDESMLNFATSIESRTKKILLNTIYEIQATSRLIWNELALIDSIQHLIEVTSTMKSTCKQLRDSKFQFGVSFNLDPTQFSRVHFNGLSPRQKQNIPTEKHETLTKVLKSVCKLIEEIIAVLGEYNRIINKPNFIVPENFTAFISSICKVIKSVESKVRSLSTDSKEESETSLFYLRQAIISEVVDITNSIRVIEEDLETLDPTNMRNLPSIYQAAHVIRYVKVVMQENGGDSDKIMPYVPKPLSLLKVQSDNKIIAKSISLKNVTKASTEAIHKELIKISEECPLEPSPKKVVYIATKIRSIRNALRNVKGARRVRSLSREAHLTMRILDVNKNPDLQRELDEDELAALERALDGSFL